MKTVLDVETTWAVKNDDRNPSPYLPGNKLVSVGVACYNDDNTFIGSRYFFFNHADLKNDDLVKENTARLKAILAKTTLLICHHVKFDLAWIRECGFEYDGNVFCTMIAEYMLQRGVKSSLALEDLCSKYGLTQKRVDLIQPYYEKGMHFYDIPMGITETYGMGDINSTWGLYLAQCGQYLRPANRGLVKIRDWMFRFCKALTRIEAAGIKIDLVELEKIKKEYTLEYKTIEDRLHDIVHQVHGDKKINFNSPEQLSEFIYGVKVIDKPQWTERFGIKVVQRGAVSKRARPKLKESTLKQSIAELTTPVLKTRAMACPACEGNGIVNQVLRSGKIGNRLIKCKSCSGNKIVYTTDGTPGSLGLIFLADVSMATSGGFKTDKSLIEKAKLDLDRKKYALAWEFLELIHKLNQISTYLDTFIGGIERNVGRDEILHPEFMQCVTATGRLSSRNPNFQNQPRGGTFPVRRCIVSRFDGGRIIEADYKALEYRCAVSLARDEAGRQDILTGVDAHIVTKDIIGCNRQDAKPHTFKPLYGGSTGSENEQRYYAFFMDKHSGIAKWHEFLQNEAIRDKRIKLPTGREYAFPLARRLFHGGSTFATQIKNYPVQGFATGDIVPLASVIVVEEMVARKLRSVVINEVHDNLLVDTYPGEEDTIIRLLKERMEGVSDILMSEWNYDIWVPLTVEIKIGYNNLDMQEIKL